MFIKIKKRQDIIVVNDSFMNIDAVTDDVIEGRVKYTTNQVKLIQDLAKVGSVVRITFSTKNPKRDNPFKNLNLQMNAEMVPKKVTTLYRDSVEFAKNIEKASILEVRADSSSKINNQLISAVKTNRSDIFNAVQNRSSQFTLQSVKEIGDRGIFAPILQTTSVKKDEGVDFQPKISLKNMLVTEAKDASSIVAQSLPGVSSKEALAGTFSKKLHVSDTLDSFYRHLTRTPKIGAVSTEELEDTRKILVVENVLNNNVTVEKTFSLPFASIKNTDGTYKSLFVFFEVLDVFGVTRQQVERKIDLSKAIETFQTPKIAPSLSIYKNAKEMFGSLRIRQEDPNAKYVKLYRKMVSHVSSEADDYVYADQFELTKSEGEKIVVVDVPAGSTIIYRAIPVSVNGLESFEFSNVVMTSNAVDRRFKHASLAYKITDNGIELEIREISTEAVCFDIIRKNLTLHERTYSKVTTSTILVEPGQSHYQAVDSFVKKKHVYEYAVELHFKDGRKRTVGNMIIEYVPNAQSVVDTKINNMQVSFDPEPNVTFDLETNVSSTDIDTLTKLLQQNNLLDFFSADVLKERSKLNDLICYEVHRQDMTSGKVENFGIISDKTFSDEKLRVINSVEPLKFGRQYRYMVITLLRSPETLFEDFEKEAVDPGTRKTYKYKPFKFFQPLTLERGAITTAKSLKLNHAKQPFAFGHVGSYVTTEVSFEKNTSNVGDVKAETIFDDFIVVRWRYDGVLSDVDHFLVMKEFQGTRTVIGKSHALSGNRVFQYIKKMSEDDMGELEFIVVPIFNDYQLGNEAVSNRLTVTR